MKDRPILFSGAMVRQLLAGTKTQTRRAIKPQPHHGPVGEMVHLGDGSWAMDDGDLSGQWQCPYGVPGDALIVRETTQFPGEFDHLKPTAIPERGRSQVRYVADGLQPGYGKQRPAIHMPSWASRLTLEITDVRVQRLNEISEADALAEGVVWDDAKQAFWVPGVEHPNKDFPYLARCTPREMYAALWDTINGSGEWLRDSFVWAVSFEVYRCNINDYLKGRIR